MWIAQSTDSARVHLLRSVSSVCHHCLVPMIAVFSPNGGCKNVQYGTEFLSLQEMQSSVLTIVNYNFLVCFAFAMLSVHV